MLQQQEVIDFCIQTGVHGMHGPHKGALSSFAAAAKVIFDSAQKTGAVKPLESNNRLYAQQLKRIQHLSKKRGGALGGVTFKLAEFLSTSPPPSSLKKPPVAKCLAENVPLLDIPSFLNPADGSAGTSSVTVVHEQATRDSKPKPAILSPLARQKDVADTRENPGNASNETEPVASSLILNIPIVEDKPLFEAHPALVPQQPTSATIAFAAQPAKESLEARPSLRSNNVAVPTDAPRAKVPVKKPFVSQLEIEMVSVDLWERQRKAELDGLQIKKMEEEKRQMAAQLERDHQSLGNLWAEKRLRVSTEILYPLEDMCMLRDIEISPSFDDALVCFKKVLDRGNRAAPLILTAGTKMVDKLNQLDSFKRIKYLSQFSGIVETAAIPVDLKSKLKLLFHGGEKFVEIYNTLNDDARVTLDRRVVRKGVAILTRYGHWEEAIRLVNASKTFTEDHTNSLDLVLLSNASKLDKEAKSEVISFVTKNVNASGRMGTAVKLALACTEKGARCKHLLLQLASSESTDETVYAELIKRTNLEGIQAVLSDVEQRGLNRNDPKILEAVLLRTIYAESPIAVFKEIEQQICLIDVRPMHISAALRAAKLSPTKDILCAALKVVKLLPNLRPELTLRHLVPLLFANKMYVEIADLTDALGEYTPIPESLPTEVALINDSLRSLGRPPLSELSAKDISSPLPDVGARISHHASLSSAQAETDLSEITEIMLAYAKDREWKKAVETLTRVDDLKTTNSATLTLIYNCALSAAVDYPDAALDVFHRMKEKEIALNSTTVNTLLSTLGRSLQWEKAIELFDELGTIYRDTNTYLVLLSVLGKHNQWEKAASVFDQAKATQGKLPISVFTVAIGAISNHSWSETMRIFQDMIKHHGSNIKDNVVNQVIQCLERNGRSGEIGMIERQLEKKRKKK